MDKLMRLQEKILASQQAVYFFGQHKVEFRNAANIMREKLDRYFVVYIGPVGMMVQRFRKQGNAAHKTECVDKISELEFFVQAAVSQLPAVEFFDT